MKTNKKISALLVALLIFSMFAPQLLLAKGVPRMAKDMQASVLTTEASVSDEKESPAADEPSVPEPPAASSVNEPASAEDAVSCVFEMPDKPVYDAKFVAVRKKGVVAKGELFETEVYIKNTGNTPWFSADSGCPYLITGLGTEKERDRTSPLFTEDLFWQSGWLAGNRILMETKRVNPGELAVFRFWSRAPMKDLYLREFYAPVIEGVTWLDNGRFHTDIKIGEGNLDPEKKELLKYIEYSGDLSTLNVEGDKSIEVSISRQKMWLKIGDTVIREFPVSTGTARTPTPIGTTKISHKQEVRVAGGWPHYIMPKWMTYRAGGYGIHALPSLANDNGVFWREALNHIGTRRSHGCIRLLPGDAEFAYNFADIGTTVNVFW